MYDDKSPGLPWYWVHTGRKNRRQLNQPKEIAGRGKFSHDFWRDPIIQNDEEDLIIDVDKQL